MRIFGGHDYYDCGMALGRDPSITLFRDKSDDIGVNKAGGSLLEEYLLAKSSIANTHKGYVAGKNIAIVFCNKVYKGLLIETNSYSKPEGIWSAKKLNNWKTTHNKENRDNLEIKVSTRWGSRYSKKKTKISIEEYFIPTEVSPTLKEYMITNRISILVEQEVPYYKSSNFQVNPSDLKSFDFSRVLDPYTAFQELSMWVGGVLGGVSPEIVTIKNDIVKLESHGFDKITSFRGPRIK